MSEQLRMALIGDPVAHSLSPRLQMMFAREAGVDCVYEAVRVREGEAGPFVQNARKTLRGFNVTMPHKSAVIAFLDTLDDSARRAQAVNTVVNEGGRLTGYNTDGAGFAMSLDHLGLSPQNALVLGDSDTATSVAPALVRQGVQVTVVARRVEKEIERDGCLYVPWALLSRYAPDCDLLVNATAFGMKAFGEFPSLSFISKLRPDAFVYDVLYEHHDTELVRMARERGLGATSGIPMLVGQAVLAFFLYTGVMPDDKTIERGREMVQRLTANATQDR